LKERWKGYIVKVEGKQEEEVQKKKKKKKRTV
jgi:hypothetical protein